MRTLTAAHPEDPHAQYGLAMVALGSHALDEAEQKVRILTARSADAGERAFTS